MTYDTFHEGAERIYLAGNKFELQGDGFSYFSPNLLADYIKQKLSGGGECMSYPYMMEVKPIEI